MAQLAMLVLLANVAAQARRDPGARPGTETLPRRCLKPHGVRLTWA
jgi:hypothetical protein